MNLLGITPSIAARGIVLVGGMSHSDLADTAEAVTTGDVASLATDANGRIVGPPAAARQRELLRKLRG